MGIINITTEQLETLEPPEPGLFLEWQTTPTPTASVRKERQVRIETLEECRIEDGCRGNGFSVFASQHSLWDDDELHFDPDWLQRVLRAWAAGGNGLPAVASATYLRNRRLALFGSILKLIDGNRDLDVALVSVSSWRWHLPIKKWPWGLAIRRMSWRRARLTSNKAA